MKLLADKGTFTLAWMLFLLDPRVGHSQLRVKFQANTWNRPSPLRKRTLPLLDPLAGCFVRPCLTIVIARVACTVTVVVAQVVGVVVIFVVVVVVLVVVVAVF